MYWNPGIHDQTTVYIMYILSSGREEFTCPPKFKNGVIIIVSSKGRYSLDSLLNQITKKNLHHLDEFTVEGNEVW
ncbi:MAG TPA: hypothetical protein DCY86_09775 [Bdellovibrionales bacterium]|nr:hypothetical protein [Bdellovibrionales bacterium]